MVGDKVVSIDRVVSIDAWPAADRPRERLAALGAAHLSEAELLALILGTGAGRAGLNALDAGRMLLSRFDGLQGVAAAGAAELAAQVGIGPVKAARVIAALELGRRLAAGPVVDRPRFRCSADVFREYGPRLGGLPRESFVVVLLDARNRRIKDVTVAVGGLSAAILHPRDVFLPAVREGAAAILCLHNHPSGDPSPSREDIALTERLCATGEVVGIPLLDHIVVGAERYVSLADRGLMGESMVGRPAATFSRPRLEGA